MEGVLGMDLQGLLPPLLAMNNVSGSAIASVSGLGVGAPQVPVGRSRKLVIDGKELGSGSFGTVFKAKYNCLPCVVKVLHPKFQNGILRESAYRECSSFLSTLRHPNIVLFIDVQEYWPPSPSPGSQPLIALIMEMMDENLTTYMKRWKHYNHMPWHVLVNVSHDVSLALHYLHSRGLAYLVLSSNNILLQSGRAKISDHSVSRLPGSRSESVYTAPEVRMNVPSLQSDVFSFGVLLMQMITMRYPEPKFMLTHDMSSGSLTMATELSRRKSDFSLIPRKHRLRQTVLHCIADSEQTRPTTEELCTDFEVLKKKKEYQRSVMSESKRSQVSSDDEDSSSDESTSSEEEDSQTSSAESSDNSSD